MINESNRNIYQRYHFKKIPIEVGHKAVTNRCFSSVSSIDPSITKRYEKNTFLVEQRFHYVKFKGVVLDDNADPELSIEYMHQLSQNPNITITSVKELCHKEGLRFRVTRHDSLNDVIILDFSRDWLNNEKFKFDCSTAYIFGMIGFPHDNLNIRVLEIMNYNARSYEARESLNARSYFYYTHPLEYIQSKLDENIAYFRLLELEEVDDDGNKKLQLYYQNQPVPVTK